MRYIFDLSVIQATDGGGVSDGIWGMVAWFYILGLCFFEGGIVIRTRQNREAMVGMGRSCFDGRVFDGLGVTHALCTSSHAVHCLSFVWMLVRLPD